MYFNVEFLLKERMVIQIFAVIFAVFFLVPSAKGSGKEVVVINGSHVYSFFKSDFDLKTAAVMDENAVHFIVDEYPVFKLPFGLKKYAESLMSYPEEAIRNHAEGVVLVNFVVEKDGHISNVRILRGIGYGCDDEVLRVFKEFPSATPGKIGGKPVRVGMTLPVRFELKN